MLSNKMTVSLMSLITLFALAFVATPAMAEFGVAMSIHPDDDISSADNAQADPLKPARIRVKFDKIVVKGSGTGFDKSDIKVFAQDMYGRPVKSPTLSAVSDYTPADGLNYMFTVPVPTAGTAKVVLYMEKHAVELADPRAEIGDDGKRKAAGKSKAVAYEIQYLTDFDHGAPRVYGIRRASPHERPAVLKETSDSFQVVITLSEQPKEFKKDHINVSNATAADPIALIPINATKDFAAFGAGLTAAPTALPLYSDTTVTPNVIGLHQYLNADDAAALASVADYADLSADLQNAAKAYITARGAYETQRTSGPDNTAYFLTIADDNIPVTKADDSSNDQALLPRTLPDSKLTIVTESPSTGQIQLTTIVTADSKIDVSKAPAIPKRADYADNTGYQAALTDYRRLNDAYMEYTKAGTVNTAYKAAVEQASKDHDAAIQAYLDENISNSAVVGALQKDMPSTGTDGKLHRYYVVITPKFENKNDVVVKVKEFSDFSNPPMKYTPPITDRGYTEGYDKLTVKIDREDLTPLTSGFEVFIPKEKRIPASGYIVFAKNNAGSGVADNPENDKDEPKPSKRTPAQLLYNLVELSGLPNLESFLMNGGTIDLVGEGLYISEIMWGSDASLSPNNNSQWIEIANTGTSSILTGDKTHKLVFYGLNEALPAVSTVADRVGTVGAGGRWVPVGQSGRTGTGEQAADVVAVVPTRELVSMQRLMGADGTTPADGTLSSSWGASAPPGVNFDLKAVGTRIGSPGAAPHEYPATPTPTPTPTPAPTIPVATATDIAITEIMVDTGNGRLPQWIELTNVSGKEVSLAGWSVDIENAAADADVEGSSLEIDLSAHTLGVRATPNATGNNGQSLVLVGGTARTSGNLAGNDRVVNITSALGAQGRYTFLSSMGFMVKLLPPQTTGVLAYGDTAGNLGAAAAWDIKMDETGRSSLIRLNDATGMVMDGTAENGWKLASSTSLVDGPATWIGSDEDAGTPGYDSGGPLPVELSHFRPARDKATGQVVITWATQSELNNAGFFIKRSQQRDGEFKVINATMIAGAGTTSEKQFYTYTDTTAQPNIVYYYQIEDVSLDGQRQTLTRGIRLKGHIGAAGKLTATWGELKTSNE